MKNLKVLTVFCCVSLLLFSNCSDDSTTNNQNEVGQNNELMAKLTTSELNTAIAAFVTISNSSQFLNFKTASKFFAAKLNGCSDAPVSNRAAFVTWINSNLSRTLFPTVTSALTAFDNQVSLGTTFVNANTTFWASLRNVDSKDIKAIFAPVYEEIENESNGSVCENACMTVADNDMSAAWINYGSSQMSAAQSGNYGQFATNLNNYYCTLADIGYAFSQCYGSCSL